MAIRSASDPKVAYLRSLSPEEKLVLFDQACALAEALRRERPDRQELLARRDPLSPESERTWLRLVQEGLRARGFR